MEQSEAWAAVSAEHSQASGGAGLELGVPQRPLNSVAALMLGAFLVSPALADHGFLLILSVCSVVSLD